MVGSTDDSVLLSVWVPKFHILRVFSCDWFFIPTKKFSAYKGPFIQCIATPPIHDGPYTSGLFLDFDVKGPQQR